MPRASLHLRPTRSSERSVSVSRPNLSYSLAMSHPASSSHRYQLHTPPTSPMSALMARSSTPDLLDEWAVVSDDEGNSIRAEAESAITARSEQNGTEKCQVTKCKVVVPVEYAGGLSELISLLTAHDAARSAGNESATSGQEALANTIKQLKHNFAGSAAGQNEVKDDAAARAVGVIGRGPRGPGADHAKPSGFGNRAIVEGQQTILAKLEQMELRHMEQDAAREDERARIVVAALAGSLPQLRLSLRQSLSPFVASLDDFSLPPPTSPANPDDIELSVQAAYVFVSDYCRAYHLALPHYSYAPRAAVPSCHRFNGSLTGGVCTVQLGTPTDKHLGGVVTVRGSGEDAAEARGAAYVALAKALRLRAGSGTEVVLANGERLGLVEAEAFLRWYCSRFHFAPPAVEHTQATAHDAVPGVWRGTLSVAGRRIGMGEALGREEATARARLDAASYLQEQDRELWESWVREKKADEEVRAEFGEKIDRVVGEWERGWLAGK